MVGARRGVPDRAAAGLVAAARVGRLPAGRDDRRGVGLAPAQPRGVPGARGRRRPERAVRARGVVPVAESRLDRGPRRPRTSSPSSPSCRCWAGAYDRVVASESVYADYTAGQLGAGGDADDHPGQGGRRGRRRRHPGEQPVRVRRGGQPADATSRSTTTVAGRCARRSTTASTSTGSSRRTEPWSFVSRVDSDGRARWNVYPLQGAPTSEFTYDDEGLQVLPAGSSATTPPWPFAKAPALDAPPEAAIGAEGPVPSPSPTRRRDRRRRHPRKGCRRRPRAGKNGRVGTLPPLDEERHARPAESPYRPAARWRCLCRRSAGGLHVRRAGHRDADPDAADRVAASRRAHGVPRGVRVGCGDVGVPGRGLDHRGRARAVDLGHVRGDAGADPRRVDGRPGRRPLPPVGVGPRPHRGPRAAPPTGSRWRGRASSRRAPGTSTRPGWTSTGGSSTGCWRGGSIPRSRSTTGTSRRRCRTPAAGRCARRRTGSGSTRRSCSTRCGTSTRRG